MVSHCRHCAQPLGGSVDHARGFCCEGCRVAFRTIEATGLLDYYDLRTEPRPEPSPPDPGDTLWLERAEEGLRSATGPSTLRVSIDGLHCAACVWLIERLLERAGAGATIEINAALGTATLRVPRTFELGRFAATLADVGYRLGPETVAQASAADDLLWRVGVTSAIALNVMSFAVARYAGLTAGDLADTLSRLELGLASVSLVVGGPVFFRAAWRGLRQGVLHLDLPIALGLLASFGGSLLLTLSGRPDAAFYDTTSVFLALMLVGRFLRERVLERNRAMLRGHQDASSLLVRVKRAEGGASRTTVVPARDVAIGDELVLAPLDVSPVRGVLSGDVPARLSSAWLSGESADEVIASGGPVAAGMANAEPHTITVRATETLETSSLLALMQTPRRDERYGEARSPVEATIARGWVAGVLVAAALAALVTGLRGGDAGDVLRVVTTVLVVTCPCGFGLAVPLAQEIIHLRLRRERVLVRSSTLLERVLTIRHAVFDKTGTLTDTRIGEGAARALADLAPADAAVLQNLADRSRHPKAQPVRAALRALGYDRWLELDATEEPGRGLRCVEGGHVFTLGGAEASTRDAAGDVRFTKDGLVLWSATTEDDVLPGTPATLEALRARGLDVHLLTGDTKARADRIAARLGIASERVVASASPADKATYVRGLKGASLFVGDGLNDALAAQAATTSGTPARGATFLATRTDFYLLGDGVAALPLLLDAALTTQRARRRGLGWAAAYNTLALSLSMAGWMTPLTAAVAMPLSTLVSIAIVLATTRVARTPTPAPARSELAWMPST